VANLWRAKYLTTMNLCTSTAVGCPLPGPTVWERDWVALIRMLQTTCSYIAIVDI